MIPLFTLVDLCYEQNINYLPENNQSTKMIKSILISEVVKEDQN